ncbi:hypothetical protein BG910_07155 [Neisseria chenwenguii]|uniref:Uncharacterized protein n=1 Tax=Neisseria chenwenguii TaxID=1853278 RepID=A0A220S2A4_9NEIS|nr:hypothetical protein BG910_07155 [Neisseria chenwenguii]ROV55630.1 hypothetical protein EGS38_09000 [Neisseria chenwenguii]
MFSLSGYAVSGVFSGFKKQAALLDSFGNNSQHMLVCQSESHRIEYQGVAMSMFWFFAFILFFALILFIGGEFSSESKTENEK